MTDRSYRSILGFALLAGLYLEYAGLMYAIASVLLLESITNFRLPQLLCRIHTSPACIEANTLQNENMSSRFSIEAERIWRLLVGFLLLTTYYFYHQLWFFPWFMGFAIFGAGVSGVCPVLLSIRWAGFK